MEIYLYPSIKKEAVKGDALISAQEELGCFSKLIQTSCDSSIILHYIQCTVLTSTSHSSSNSLEIQYNTHKILLKIVYKIYQNEHFDKKLICH